MPTDTVHIPIMNLESGRMYEYTIRLLSSGGVSLSDEERSSVLTGQISTHCFIAELQYNH